MKRTSINLSNLDPNTITKLIRMLVKELAKAQDENRKIKAVQHMAEQMPGPIAWKAKAAATEVATASKPKKAN